MIREEFKNNHFAARTLHKRWPKISHTIGGYVFDARNIEGENRYGYDGACQKIVKLRTIFRKRERAR